MTETVLAADTVGNALTVLSSGKILLAIAAVTSGGQIKLGVLRFPAAGSPDATFGGGDGRVLIAFSHHFIPFPTFIVPGRGATLASCPKRSPCTVRSRFDQASTYRAISLAFTGTGCPGTLDHLGQGNCAAASPLPISLARA